MAAAIGKLAANPNIIAAATNFMKDPKLASSVAEKFSNISPSVTKSGSTSTTYQSFRSMNAGLCRVIAFIWDKLKIIFRFLFLTRSPAAYIAWLLIIILIILGIVGGITIGKRKVRLAKNPNVKAPKPKSSALSDDPTNEGWRRRAVQQTTSGEPNKVDGYKRNELSGGRCDGLNWLSDPDSKKDCIKNLPPPTIRWELSSDDYPEMKDLPEKYLNENMNKQSINIPYRLVNDRFYADCSGMTYQDGDKAKLFIQKNIKDSMCYFVEKTATPYKDENRKQEFTDIYKICKD